MLMNIAESKDLAARITLARRQGLRDQMRRRFAAHMHGTKKFLDRSPRNILAIFAIPPIQRSRKTARIPKRPNIAIRRRKQSQKETLRILGHDACQHFPLWSPDESHSNRRGGMTRGDVLALAYETHAKKLSWKLCREFQQHSHHH